MNGAKTLVGALALSILAVACSAGPGDEATPVGSALAVTAAGQSTAECHGHHPPPPVCADTNPNCTSKHRAASASDPIEAKLAQLCSSQPFDWKESNSDGSKFIEETFFLCPDTAALHAFVDPLSGSGVHTASDACGACIPSAPHGFTYVVTSERENAPNCGTTCPGPSLSRW